MVEKLLKSAEASGLRACRASVLVLPTLLFYGRFPVGLSSRTKVAGFATSSPSELHATASKPRTGLRTRPSAAKCLQEPDFDVQKSLGPPKSVENCEKLKKKTNNFRKIFRTNFFCRKKWKITNLPKRVLPKFRGDLSHVRRVRRRLGGIREA